MQKQQHTAMQMIDRMTSEELDSLVRGNNADGWDLIKADTILEDVPDLKNDQDSIEEVCQQFLAAWDKDYLLFVGLLVTCTGIFIYFCTAAANSLAGFRTSCRSFLNNVGCL